jgi:hypothetical protein
MKLRVLTVVVANALLVTSALAQSVFSAKLVGLRETPIVISGANGHATVTISHDEKSIDYELTYNGLEGSAVPNGKVLFAHIHVGRPTVTGGVAVFFCGGGNTDATKKACPAAAGPGTPNAAVQGTWTAADITGPAVQGVDPTDPNGEDSFARLVKAIKSGLSYANVHTTRSPGGEIRGQLQHDRDNDRHDDDDQ